MRSSRVRVDTRCPLVNRRCQLANRGANLRYQNQTHLAPWGTRLLRQALQMFLTASKSEQLGSTAAQKQLTRAQSVTQAVQKLFSQLVQWQSTPREGMMHCPRWKTQPRMQLKQEPELGSQVAQRVLASMQAPFWTQQPEMQEVQALPTMVAQQGMKATAAMTQVGADSSQPWQQSVQWPVARSLFLHRGFSWVHRRLAFRKYPLEHCTHTIPSDLMQKVSLLPEATSTTGITHLPCARLQPWQQPLQPSLLAVQPLQRGSRRRQVARAERQKLSQHPEQAPMALVALQLGSPLLPLPPLPPLLLPITQLFQEMTQPGQQLRQAPLLLLLVLHSGSDCVHCPELSERQNRLEHSMQTPFSNFWQLVSMVEVPPISQSPFWTTQPGQQERQLPERESAVLQRGLICLHLPSGPRQKRFEHLRQRVLVVRSNCWQLGSRKAIPQLPEERLQPGKQAVQVPSASEEVLQSGLKGRQRTEA